MSKNPEVPNTSLSSLRGKAGRRARANLRAAEAARLDAIARERARARARQTRLETGRAKARETRAYEANKSEILEWARRRAS